MFPSLDGFSGVSGRTLKLGSKGGVPAKVRWCVGSGCLEIIDSRSISELAPSTKERLLLSFNVQNPPNQRSSTYIMSAAAEGSSSTTKAVTSDETSGPTLKDQQKPAAALEEDDEFEDFPVEGKPTTPSSSFHRFL